MSLECLDKLINASVRLGMLKRTDMGVCGKFMVDVTLADITVQDAYLVFTDTMLTLLSIHQSTKNVMKSVDFSFRWKKVFIFRKNANVSAHLLTSKSLLTMMNVLNVEMLCQAASNVLTKVFALLALLLKISKLLQMLKANVTVKQIMF